MAKKLEIDMCNGPLLKKIIRFTVPVILSGVLQLLFNAADTIVVGKFAGTKTILVGSINDNENLPTKIVRALERSVIRRF